MTQDRKYAALPDLDEAPDIYETPELADDTSTLQTSTAARSPSPSDSESSEADPASGINRHRLRPRDARSQFRSSRVDAREVDFSDRVSSKRRAYRISSRRGRAGTLIEGNEDGEEDWDGEDDDEDGEEGLDRRLARLIREAQEVQSELDRRTTQGQKEDTAHEESEDAGENDDDEVSAKFQKLNLALEKIRYSQKDADSAHAKLAKQLARGVPEQQQQSIPETTSEPENTETAAAPGPAPADTTTLSKVADFDARLASLERALGVSSLDAPSSSTAFAPVIPTLTLLDRQVNLLSSVPSQPHLDAIIQKLHLAQTEQHRAAAAANRNGDDADNIHTPTNTASSSSSLTAEEMAKLRSLYSILPQLNTMAPTLPPLLARLRSLRTIHSNAAAASQTLDEIERKQDEADHEIKEWTEGLAKVAEAVKAAEGDMKESVGAVDGWVKDLEQRIENLG
ncbi:hypothetical protein AAFC00_000953 [Neodothiora populina]|uniref:Dynactin subunit n=1 Tax=Neodothiora populina TaxID=2781224 RepID=A0ABR3PMC6_9PEZI